MVPEEKLEVEIDRVNAAVRKATNKPNTKDLKEHAKRLQEERRQEDIDEKVGDESGKARSQGRVLPGILEQKLKAFSVRLAQYDTAATEPVTALDPRMELQAAIELTSQQLRAAEKDQEQDFPDVVPLLEELGALLHRAGRFSEAAGVYGRLQRMASQVRAITSASQRP